MAEVKKILPKNIFAKFDTIVTADMLKRGKPHPLPYLTAAKNLKIAPAKCLVVENSPLGVLSAKNAGMFCVAVTTSLPKCYLKKADIVIDLKELVTLDHDVA